MSLRFLSVHHVDADGFVALSRTGVLACSRHELMLVHPDEIIMVSCAYGPVSTNLVCNSCPLRRRSVRQMQQCVYGDTASTP